jgi:hypothetical protein
MSTTYAYTGTLNIVACFHCGMNFGVTSTFYSRRVGDHATFYCPAGHGNAYRGRSREEQLVEQLDAARSMSRRERERRERAERSAAAHKGQVTKIRKRVANGVCPCCNRSFQDLGRHMKGQHPDFAVSS